jgi:AraC-like DNA-binding protein
VEDDGDIREYMGTVAVPGVLYGEADRRLKEQMEAWMMSHISDPQVTADNFAMGLGYGRTNFFKKVKQLTGMTPNDYIRKIRLEKAAELLLTTNMTAAEVAYKVGFDDQYYFSKSFKRYFGQPPSQYRKGSEKSQEES